jgi:hypothetical protein
MCFYCQSKIIVNQGPLTFHPHESRAKISVGPVRKPPGGKEKKRESLFGVMSPRNKERRDPSALAFSLSSHRHSHVSLLFSSRFIVS